MFRFTIRDWLWATVLVGFALHSWAERCKWRGREVRLRQIHSAALSERDRDTLALKCYTLELQRLVKQANERAGNYADALRQVQMERLAAKIAEEQPSPAQAAVPPDTSDESARRELR
jgi:hypothetical protein